MDACTISSVHYLTSVWVILTWPTQLTKSKTVPNVVTTKINSGYICSRHAQNQYRSLRFHCMVTVIEFQSLLLLFLLNLAISFIVR